MQDTIYLEKTAAKCIAASYPCALKGTCARHLVSADGRTLADNSGPTGVCALYLPASKCRTPPCVQREAHEYVGGLL